MKKVPEAARRNVTRLKQSAALVLCGFLALSWVVAAFYMWHALATSPGQPDPSRLLGAPTPRTVVTAVIFSGMELGIVLGALWPWKPDYYASRLAIVALALVTWVIMITPMDLIRLDRVHRSWLFFVAGAVILALLGLLVYRTWRRLTGRYGEAGKVAVGG